MKLDIKITVACDNAALADDPERELIRMFSNTATRAYQQLERGPDPLPVEWRLRDSNGNTVGKLSIAVAE